MRWNAIGQGNEAVRNNCRRFIAAAYVSRVWSRHDVGFLISASMTNVRNV